MIKKYVLSAYFLLTILLMNGCWNYRGLNDMEIVSGMAIDKKDDNYVITLELLDLSGSAKDGVFKQNLVECEGKTIFDAFRNSNKLLSNNPYYGNMDTVIINQDIAKNEGLDQIIDLLLRNGELRDNLIVLISQEASAKDIFLLEPVSDPIISSQLSHVLREDAETSSSTIENTLYEIYSDSRAPGRSLVMPAVKGFANNDKKVAGINGLAAFKKGKLINFLPAMETVYYLLAIDQIEAGILTINTTGQPPDQIALEILDSKTKRDFSYTDQKIKITLEPEVTVRVVELGIPIDQFSEESLKNIEAQANEALLKKMQAVIQKIQTEFDSDILGFGNLIYRKDHKLWATLEENWERDFSKVEVEIKPKVSIVDTSLIRSIKKCHDEKD